MIDFSFSVKHDGKIDTYSYPVPDPLISGDYKIEVVKTEPFDTSYATFIVTKDEPIKKND